ncbi:hypothetical protein SPBR_02613 [Sporothrix brasiliensis 5110]|uniref:Maintenance of telomere capping protein 1 n=1 Tax=Sporothrix brasiliensis 5110 TaxID=1398154 RepID=A0A0C2J854_9PEZI|nr:uncharacterized protein SPBR_02613 [Sporothrix brasiliensis 5110]KIH93192.1 hypothetical protein SPBR_02613 [Sporothrix brasiliensis 5110]
MASKRAKSATNEELDSLFEGIGDEKPTGAAKKAGKSKTTGTGKLKSAADKDLLAALENEVGDEIARPHTPRISKEAKASPASASASAPAPARRSVESSKAYSARTSTDERAVDASAEGAAAPPAAAATTATPPTVAAPASGGWWGGILSTASAAMKQAEAAVKEIQQNEEAKKWADQVRGNVVSLRGFGDELRHRALPTFTNILHTLAPPIASHERLLIHITHDMVGYPALDPLVHGVFTRVMAQVEGGDLLVIQRGQESQAAGSASMGGSGSGSSGGHSRNSAGWRDGPWWRVVHYPRDLGAVPGLREGTKLCRASAEAYANEYYAAHYGSDDKDKATSKGGARDRVADSKRGLAVARQRAVEPVSEQNPVRRSDIFLAVQAFTVAAEPKDEDEDEDEDEEDEEGDDDEDDDDEATDASDESDELVQFAVHIRDPVHDIVYHTVSQALPAKWVRWLDARPSTSASALTPATSGGEGEGEGEEEEDDDDDSSSDDDSHDADGASAKPAKVSAYDAGVPDEIREIIDSGAVDPREWVAEWIEETLTLAVGVVAQRYVARRMGVGAGSIGRGKRPVDEILADNAGEAARAGII